MLETRFNEKLLQAAQSNKSWLCVGLDPDVDKLPKVVPKNLDGIAIFLKNIIDITKDIVCAYKPNSAFYEAFGAKGIELLKNIIDYIPKKIPVILDAKRGDIGNTSRMYARFAFEYLGADAITVNPYMGYDSLKPFLDYNTKCVFILCLTSNPSSADFQKQVISGGDKAGINIYELVARKAVSWTKNGNIGLVVGATSPEELGSVRQIVGEDIPILIPGVGAQGGDLENSLKQGANSKGQLAIINVSRNVLYASSGDDYAERAREVAMGLVGRMQEAG
jgi:orotidine-5'-phosphate decarboxylase